MSMLRRRALARLALTEDEVARLYTTGGEPAPRTCERCGLGPCPDGVVRRDGPGVEALSLDDPEARAMARLDAPACELCGDQPEVMHLHARCHLTAPLRAEIESGVLTLYCYVPECGRVVARFKVAGRVK